MAERATKPPGKYKELFAQKSESEKEARKKRRKKQEKQTANVDENQQYSLQPQEYSAVTHGESSTENKQYSDETLLKSTAEGQQSLNAKIGAETTERSNNRDRNGDEDSNEINEELSFESSAKGQREEEDPNTLKTSNLAPQQSKSAESSTLHQLENKTAKFAGPLSIRRSKKRSKGKVPSGQDKKEPKKTEGSEIPVVDKKSVQGSDKETCEDMAIKEEVKLEFGAATIQKDHVTSFKSLEGVPKKLLDKGHKGKTLKQFASFGRNKKKAGITASYSRTSLEDENLDMEPQKETNEERIRSDAAENHNQGNVSQQPSSGLHGNLLQEPVAGKSDPNNQGIVDGEQVQEENQEKAKEKGTKPGLKKSKSYVKILRKKLVKDEEKQSSAKQIEKSSKSNDGGGDKPLESAGTGQEILHEQNIDGTDLRSEAIQSNREITQPQTDDISRVQDDAGDEGTEGVEIKQTSSKKEKKEGLLRRQIKKLRSPSKDEEDKEKNSEEADEAGTEGGEQEDEGDNGLDKNDVLSADNEITKPMKRKKSGLRKSLSRALKRKKRANEDAQDQVGETDEQDRDLAGEQEDPNEATTEGAEIPEIQEDINSLKTSLEVLEAKQTQGESEEMEKSSKEGKTPSDNDNQDRSVELEAKENNEECIPNKETTGDDLSSEVNKETASHSQEHEETSLESAKSEDTKQTEDEIASEAQEMCQNLMKIVIDELMVYIAKKEALTAQTENESQVEELTIEADQNRTPSKTADEDNDEGTKAIKRKRSELKDSQDLKKRRAEDMQQDEENHEEDQLETQDNKAPEGFATEEDGSKKTNKLTDEEITDNQTEERPNQVNKELATKHQKDDEEMVDSLNENQEKSGGVEMTEDQEEREGASCDKSPENKQARQQKNSSEDQNDGRDDDEEEESSLESKESQDELQTEEKVINEERQANKKLMQVVIDELAKFIADKTTSSADEDQPEEEKLNEELENAPKCVERKADADTDDEEVRAVGESRPTATCPQEVNYEDLTTENPDTKLVDKTIKADIGALERKKNDEENRMVTEDVNLSSDGSEEGAKEAMSKQDVTEEKGAGKIKERSYDRSASVEKSLTATPRSPKEEWIVVDQLDISLEISRQLKHVLGFEERTVTCCTVM